MALSCILYYILSAILGGLFSWLLLGGKSKELKQLRSRAQQDSSALGSALEEFGSFKDKAKAQIAEKQAEIVRLKKTKGGFPDIISQAQEKEIKHWKQKSKDLEAKLKSVDNSQKDSPKPKELKELKSILAELDLTRSALEEKTLQHKTLRKQLADSKVSKGGHSTSTETVKLRKKVKKLKKKLKALKSSGEIQTIEIKETLDIAKLSQLLTEGKLTSKTKKVSKKASKKSKQQKKS